MKHGQVWVQDDARQKDWIWLMGDEKGTKLAEEIQRADPLHRPMRESARDYVRIGLEMLLENTKQVIAEGLGDKKLTKLSSEKFFEEIDTTAIVPFTRFALPIVRRVMPRMYARSLVGFQPMPMPDGKIFFFDRKYGTTKYPTTAADRIDLPAKMNQAYGGARQYMTVAGASTNPQAIPLGHYGTSKHKVYIDGTETALFDITVGGTPAAQDTLNLNVSTAGTITITFENQIEGMTARDIDVGMSSKNITAEAIKLRAGMTVETMQDFFAYHGIQSEAELTAAMSTEIDNEIDLNILSRLFYSAAAGNVNWNTAGFEAGDDNTFFKREYRKTLYEAVVAANNLVYKKRFVDTSWIVGGVGAIERMEKLEEFKISNLTPDDAQVARRFSGTLAGRWLVYKDARLSDTKLLVGYSGDSPFHQGAVFAPYIPAYMTDLMPDPNVNFKVRKGIMSRFGFDVTIPECYATVTLT